MDARNSGKGQNRKNRNKNSRNAKEHTSSVGSDNKDKGEYNNLISSVGVELRHLPSSPLKRSMSPSSFGKQDTRATNNDNNTKKRKKQKRQDVGSLDSGENITVKQGSSLSLSSRLKRSRGTAATTPLPPEWISKSSQNASPSFLSPHDDDRNSFQSCLQTSYRGFYWENPEDLPSSIHSSFSSAFDTLNNAGLFLYDAVQPGGKKLSRTFVTRTLVGEPGSTYKYLGLRLFSHPWCDVDENGDRMKRGLKGDENFGSSLERLGYSSDCSMALAKIGKINENLIHRTNRVLEKEITPKLREQNNEGGDDVVVGSAQYSLTLINRMEPSSVKHDLKPENIYGMGKTSVSWHKDSGLQDFSSIAVYHTLRDYGTGTDASVDKDHYSKRGITQSSKRSKDSDHKAHFTKDVPWRVAVRVADSKTCTPALIVPLPSGSLYYLLDDFNHQHEHAVLAGSNLLRYSSTHRVAREGRGTWQYIRDRCDSVLSSDLLQRMIFLDYNHEKNAHYSEIVKCYKTSALRKKLVKEVRSFQDLMTELEFEWIRQWHIQGKLHAELHPYWHRPIKTMINAYNQLHGFLMKLNRILEESSIKQVDAVSEDLFDVIIESTEKRIKQRRTWNERLQDPIFQAMPDEMKPFPCHVLNQEEDDFPSTVRKWRSLFVDAKGGFIVNNEKISSKSDDRKTPIIKKKRSKRTLMTKKEQKKIASNWEKMKVTMKNK